jgi:2-haloalkanoic acid dehalogenase type II
MKICAILFDLYDTLVYEEQTGTRQQAIEAITAAGIDIEDWQKAWGATRVTALRGRYATMQERVQHALYEACPTQEKPELVEKVAALLLARKTSHIHADTCDSLTDLRTRGYKLALVSNTVPDEAEYARNCGLMPYFDTILLSCETGCIKPQPEIYLLAAQRLRVAPEACIFVGDGGSQELRGAKAIGMQAIRIERMTRAEGERDSCFDAQVKDLHELLEWLDKV